MMSDDGHTIALDVCEQHPPLGEWSDRDLILGRCPACGSSAACSGEAAARMLKARRLGQQSLDV